MTAWLLGVLVLCLSDGGVTGCSVQPMIKVSNLSKVFISCPPIMTETKELSYQLLSDDSYISKLQLDKQSDSKDRLYTIKLEVPVSSNGVYTCKREILYPPPFREDCHSTEVKLLEKQPLPVINSTALRVNQSCPDWSPVIPEVVMWTTCGVLLLYNVSLSCIAIVIWRKLKSHKEEDTNIYMNTRPADLRKQCKA